MAEEVIIDIKLGSGDSVKKVGDLTKAVDQLDKSTDELTKSAKQTDKALSDNKGARNFKKELSDLNKRIKDAPTNIRAMNKQIQEFQAIALDAGRNSPIGKQALQDAAKMRDRYIDITNEVNRLANDGVKLQAALQLGQTVIGGFAAFQGITALAGVENEEFRETVIKLQGAQAALMGIEQIRSALEKESILRGQVSLALDKAKIIATNAGTAAQWLLNAAITANPIGLIVVGVAALVAGIIALVVGIGNFVGGLKVMGQAILSVLKIAFWPYTLAIRAVIAGLKAIGVMESDAAKAARIAAEERRKQRMAELRAIVRESEARIKALQKERELLAERTRLVNRAFDFELKKARLTGQGVEELEDAKLEAVRSAAQERLALLKAELEESMKLLAAQQERFGGNKFVDFITKDTEKQMAKLKENIQETGEAIDDASNDIELKRLEREKKAEEDAKKAGQKAADRRKAEIEKEQEELAFLRSLQIEATESERQELEKRQELQREDADFMDELNKEREQDLADSIQRRGELLREEDDFLKELQDEQVENEMQVKEARLAVADSVGEGLVSLSQVLQKNGQENERVQKALALVQIGIDTARAISGVTAAAASTGNPISFAVTLASGIATVLANIASAKKILGASGTTSVGGVGASVSGNVLNQPVTSGSTLIQDTQQIEVAVVESNITNTQDNVAVIEQTATTG